MRVCSMVLNPCYLQCWFIASPYFFNWSLAWAVVLVDAILPSRKHLAMPGAFWVTLTGVQKLWTSKWRRSGILLRFLRVTGILFVIIIIIKAQISTFLELETFGTMAFLFCCFPQRIGFLAQQFCCFCSYQGHRYLLQSLFFSSFGGGGCLIFHFYFLM